MKEKLHAYISEKKHHIYRRECPFSLAEEFSSENLSPAERMTRRFCRLMAEETPVILEKEDICFLRTFKSLPDIFTPEEWADIKSSHYIHELGFMSNLTPNYEKVIKHGLLSLKENADSYGKRMIDAILCLTERYKKEAIRVGRQDLADILSRVPAYGATTFHEALQSFRIIHFALWYEGNYHITIGRFDKYMYPYLENDLEKGVLTEDEAFSLLCDFFISFNKDSDLYPGVQQGDNGQSMMLGGINSDGTDAFNLLSSLCLKASYENKMIDPKINLRVSKNTPTERFTEASKLTAAGLGFPQYSNDDVVIPALMKLGYEYDDAVNYTVAACWEFIIPNVGTDVANISALSFPEVIDNALHSSLESSETYEDFYTAVENELRKKADEITESIKNLYFIPSPLMNAMMDTDIYNGGKYNNFGIHGTGLSNAADSLAVIKKYIYEEKSLDKTELIKAIDENFANHPLLLHRLRYESPKMGNNDDFVDLLATNLLDSFAKSLEGKKNCRGGIYRAGTGSAMYYLWHANEIGASPDGRLKGESFGTNFSVSLFAEVKGPLSVIASMTKQHFENAINGGPLTLEFHSGVFSDEDGCEKVGLLVKTFIDRGGHQLQLNTVDSEKLREAKLHPEKHRNLVVRIWGWSAYFTELDPEYQNHVMARQIYTI